MDKKKKQVTIQDLRDTIAKEQSSVTTHLAPWVWAAAICIYVILYHITFFLLGLPTAVLIFASLLPPVIAAAWLAVWLKDHAGSAGNRLVTKLMRKGE